MKRWLLAAVLFLPLMGASGLSEREFKQYYDSLLGSDYSAYAATLPSPTQSFDIPNGRRVIVYKFWRFSETTYNPFFDYGDDPSFYYCTLKLIVSKKGKISFWVAEGNYCRSEYQEGKK